MKSLLQNMILIIVSLVVALVIGELGLRLAGYGSGNPYERLLNNNDEYVGYRMIPGDHETIDGPDGIYDVKIVSLGFDDGRGFRDDGRQNPVHSMFFGDSFVWGYGVEIDDSISEQFEALSGKDAVNLGMTAFTSPTQYWRLFKNYVAELPAEYAFFGLFLGNDFGDSLNFDEWLLSGSQVSYPEWRTRQIRGVINNSWSLRVRRSAYDRSVLWRFLVDRINFGLTSDHVLQDNLLEINTDKLDLVLDSRQIVTSMGRNQERQIKLVRRALRQIVRTGQSSGARPIVFVIPTKELVYQSYYLEDSRRTVEDIRYRTLLELLNESGIEFIDLLPVFRQAVVNDAEQLYFRIDGHWNPTGHALAALELYRYVSGRAGH
jgi:hypothetical protein